MLNLPRIMLNLPSWEKASPEDLRDVEWPRCHDICYLKKYFTEEEIPCEKTCIRKLSIFFGKNIITKLISSLGENITEKTSSLFESEGYILSKNDIAEKDRGCDLSPDPNFK